MHPGNIVAGKYRVVSVLGRSRGLLVEARHTEFDQRVVIRILSPAMCNDKEIEQFRREAKVLSKLESEHVARIIDVGTHSDGSFYLVRQHLEGVDVGTYLKSRGALRLDEAVLYTLQAAEAVQECHSNNVILRELQPSHLFITQKRGGLPLVKLIDFGTAKLLKDVAGEPVQGEMTATVMFGMSPYSSPELVRKAKNIDHRTDVWSLGTIFYEMLAAVPPFQGEMAELMLRITRDDPIPISSLRPDLPRELDQIMSWALAKDPASRFSSVYALAHALKPFTNAEGQVLVDQIGRLAHARSQSADKPAQISPTSPLAKRASTAPGPRFEGAEATQLYTGGAPASQPGGMSPFEKTTFVADAALAAQADAYPNRGSQPPPTRGSVPPPPSSGSGLPAMRPRQGSWVEPDPVATSGLSSNKTGGYPAATPAGQQQRVRQRKMAMVAIGGSLVLLPVLVVVLVFALRDGGGEVAQNTAAAATSQPQSGSPSGGSDEDDDDDGDDGDDGPATPAATGGSDEPPPSDGDSPSGGSQPGAGGKTWQQPPPSTDGSSKSPPPKGEKPAPPPPPPPPEPSGGDGTLVAIAIGGSCAFSVDGQPKGTKSSIRIKVPVGNHTVSCTPPGGASRSQGVKVTADKPGIASFRLN
jgi:serine/threonine-protein kinase